MFFTSWLKSTFSGHPIRVKPVVRGFKPRLDILEDRLAPTGTPNGTAATTLQTFNWPAAAGADSYYLWVADQSTGQVAVNAPNLPGTSLTLTTPLTVGHDYLWWA